MRLLFRPAPLLLALGVSVEPFTVPQSIHRSLLSGQFTQTASITTPANSQKSASTSTPTTLYAKKKKGNKAKNAALAALESIEVRDKAAAASSSNTATATLDWDEDEPLSKKEQRALEKNQKQAAATAGAESFPWDDDDTSGLSKKELIAHEKKRQKEVKRVANVQKRSAAAEMGEIEKNKRKKALAALAEMEAAEHAAGTFNESEEQPKLSKKELKEQAKKAAKKAEKEEKQRIKKAAKRLGLSVDEYQTRLDAGELDGNINGIAAAAADTPESAVPPPPPTQETKPTKLTAEERIRKERPPPRIRVMESSQPDYTALRLENIAITFRDLPVLKSATWGVQTGDRIGLVGANGAGKTTQLRILAGELEPTAGDVVKSSKDLRVSMLRQEFVDELILARSLREEFLSVFTEEARIMEDLTAAEEELEGMTGDGDADAMQEVLDRMAKLQNTADAKNVKALDSRASKIMDLMGFDKEEGDYPVSAFSGGWKMRIGLGKVLLKDPNILLLDEPTNHLDLESVEWLEEFLRNQKIPMVIVSHDREFLDQVCTKIVDAEGGMCAEYQGNYSNFLQLKKARMDSWQASYKAQEKKIKEERQWINKFKLKQPQAVKQREAQLAKLVKSPDYVQKPPFVGKPFKFRFPDAPRLSPEVAEVRGLCHGYGGGANRLFEDSDMLIQKGDRIAVIGPNGSGKSTLLRILMDKEEPNEGSAQFVGQNVYPSYFEQNQADVLDLDKTVVDIVQAASNMQSYNELRALLGQFLFKGDAVTKKVENLSGGEKARLSLCCMMLKESNLLILDEPTNHLDIPAKEMLEEALQHFDGSVVVISHDRFFISKVATTIVAIEDKKLVKYGGDYNFYMNKSKEFKKKVEARYFAGGSRIGSAPVVDLEALIQPKKKNFGGAKNANMVTKKNKGIKNAKRDANLS